MAGRSKSQTRQHPDIERIHTNVALDRGLVSTRYNEVPRDACIPEPAIKIRERDLVVRNDKFRREISNALGRAKQWRQIGMTNNEIGRGFCEIGLTVRLVRKVCRKRTNVAAADF